MKNPSDAERTPVITPHARIWLVSHRRWLISCEKAALQGISSLGQLDEQRSASMAGNAFCAFIVQAVIISVLAVFRLP